MGIFSNGWKGSGIDCRPGHCFDPKKGRPTSGVTRDAVRSGYARDFEPGRDEESVTKPMGQSAVEPGLRGVPVALTY